jgi:hypothetical protein
MTTVPAVTEHWYDEFGVVQPGDEQAGWPLLTLLAGMGVAFGPLHDLVRDTDEGPGWSPLLDPARAPAWALPWLAQLAGVTLTPGAPRRRVARGDHQPARVSPRHPAGDRRRDRADADRRPAVTLRERDGGPWLITVITYTAETPDPAAAERAARSQKPAGLLMTFRVDPGWRRRQLEATYSTRTVGDIEAAFATVGDLESNLPVGPDARNPRSTHRPRQILTGDGATAFRTTINAIIAWLEANATLTAPGCSAARPVSTPARPASRAASTTRPTRRRRVPRHRHRLGRARRRARHRAARRPFNGQIIDYLADATNGVVRLRYRAAAPVAYKWEFVGGSPLENESSAAGTRASATYGDLTGTGVGPP